MAKLTMPDGAVYETADAQPEPAGEWAGEAVKSQVIKSDSTRRFTLSVGYPVNLVDAAVARDGHQDFASPEEVEKAAWNYLANSPKVGLYHEDGTEGAGTVVESYIWPGPDWTPEGSDYTVTKGDWLTGIVWDEAAWGLIEKQEITGTSMQGRAGREDPTPDDLGKLRKRN